MVPIQETIIPISAARSGRKRKGLKGVIIHETGNHSVGSNAKNHSIYMNVNGGKDYQVSYHYVVDDKEIFHLIPDDEITWQAGDGGNGVGNTQMISIEICVNPDGNFALARKNAAELTAKLLRDHGMTTVIDGTTNKSGGNVFQHNTFSPWGKNCPETIRNSGLWNAFLDDIRAFLGGNAAVTVPSTPEAIDAKPYRIRLSAGDAKSQLGAYNNLSNAMNVADANLGYSIYDKNGTLVYAGKQAVTTINVGDTVRVTGSVYDNGKAIPTWVKNQTHIVSQTDGNRVLLGYPNGIRSWVPINGIVKA